MKIYKIKNNRIGENKLFYCKDGCLKIFRLDFDRKSKLKIKKISNDIDLLKIDKFNVMDICVIIFIFSSCKIYIFYKYIENWLNIGYYSKF